MSKLRKTFALFLAIALVVTMVTPAVFAQDEEQVNRVSGANRYETSANIAAKAFPNGADAVIVVNGTDDKQFADGLAASVLAGAIKAPILLTDGKVLHQKVVEAIKQLKASKAYVLGGTSAVSENVFNALKDLVGDVERISVPGGKREDTAAAIARKANTGSNTAYVVNGYRPADAMVAGAAAFNNGNPILLVNANSIPKATSDALKDLGIENVIIVGGTAVVSQDVQAQLQAAGYNVKRLSGSKRALTAVDFAKSEFGNINGISVVNGGTVGSLSDAVGASVFGNPILFAEANSTLLNEVSEYIDGLLEDNNDLTITLFGGTSRLTTALQNQLEEKVKNAAPKELKVESVTAINPTTLKLEGEGLKNLKAEDVTVAGNKVTAVNASADGKTATLTLENALVPNKEVTVTVKVNGETKEFKVTFEYTIDKVTVNAATYDDDQKGQVVTFKVNDETTNANPEYLRQAGYDVKFVAVNENNEAANIFAGSTSATSTSSTGLLADEVPVGKYTIEVQILKDGKVVVSDKAVIEVVDLESTVTAIDSVQLTNLGTFVMKSTTLVTGETATITKIVGDAAGKKGVSIPVDLAKVESSNPAVVSVDSTTYTLTANAPGTATITVKIGNVTKTINLTVTNTARKVAKVTPSESSVKVVVGVTRKINVTALDQYGDPIAVPKGDTVVVEDIPQNASGQPLVDIGTNDDGELETGAVDGKHSGFEVTGRNKGTGTVLFKDTNGKVLGQINVTVTDVNNVASEKVEYTYDSATTNTFAVGETRKYQVSLFNKEGAFNGTKTLVDIAADNGDADTNGVVDNGYFPKVGSTDYYVISSKPSVASVTVSGDVLTVTGKGKGTADIVIYDNNGVVKHKFTVTVTETPVTITKVNFKEVGTIDYQGKTINVADVLDVRPDTINNSAVDPIVYGIEHNANIFAKVRLASSADPSLFTKNITYNSDNSNKAPDAGKLVIYIDNGTKAGELDDGDTILGLVTAQVLTGATGTNLEALAGKDLDDITLGGTNYTTGSKDKGTILFKVFVDANNNDDYEANEVVASTAINVDVK